LPVRRIAQQHLHPQRFQRELLAGALAPPTGLLAPGDAKIQRHRLKVTSPQQHVHSLQLLSKQRIVFVRPHVSQRWTKPALDCYDFPRRPLFSDHDSGRISA
jgi:hypothetical protein